MNEVPSERDDIESSSQVQPTSDERPEDRTERAQEVFETTVNSETSFLPGQGAFSSTPATARIFDSQQSFASQGSEEPSWTQSPLAKLSDELRAFSSASDLHTFNTAEHDSINDQSSSDSTFQQNSIVTIPSSAKGKGKDTAHPLLKSVLRHNLYSASDNSTFENTLKQTSPLKFRAKSKTPVVDKSRNPYLPPGSSSTNWSGVVDLHDPSVLTPQRHRAGISLERPQKGETDDDSFDGLPPGMSPLVLMSPVRPPRSSAELGLLKLKQTPTREASERIQRDLIMSALKSVHKSGIKGQHFRKGQEVVDSSMSTVPTPPSLSRYARRGDYSSVSSSTISKDASLESMIRHIKDDIQFPAIPSVRNIASVGGTGSTPGLRLRSQEIQPSGKVGAVSLDVPRTPPIHESHHDSLDSDSDSLDSINDTAHPSAAFLMASGGAQVYVDDDSFDSNHSSDSLENEDPNALGEGIVPVHPFAVNAAVVDDDFDDDDDSDDGFEVGHHDAVGGLGPFNDIDEDTVFGLAPGQRESAAYGGQHLRMLGEDLLQDTIGIGAQLAATGRVEESPTPANWGR